MFNLQTFPAISSPGSSGLGFNAVLVPGRGGGRVERRLRRFFNVDTRAIFRSFSNCSLGTGSMGIPIDRGVLSAEGYMTTTGRGVGGERCSLTIGCLSRTVRYLEYEGGSGCRYGEGVGNGGFYYCALKRVTF